MSVTASTTKEAFELLIKAAEYEGFALTPNEKKHELHLHDFQTHFSLTFMPGNRRTLISHGAVIYPEFRGKGIGTEMCKLREKMARAAGVTLLLATVRDDNAAEIRVLEKCGWRRLTQNKTTQCSLWGKELT